MVSPFSKLQWNVKNFVLFVILGFPNFYQGESCSKLLMDDILSFDYAVTCIAVLSFPSECKKRMIQCSFLPGLGRGDSFGVAREKLLYFLFVCVLKLSLLRGQKSLGHAEIGLL